MYGGSSDSTAAIRAATAFDGIALLGAVDDVVLLAAPAGGVGVVGDRLGPTG